MDYSHKIKEALLEGNQILAALRQDFIMPVVYDFSGNIVDLTNTIAKVTGRSQSELVKYNFNDLFDLSPVKGLEGIQNLLQKKQRFSVMSRPNLPFSNFFGFVTNLPFLQATLIPLTPDAFLALIGFAPVSKYIIPQESKIICCLNRDATILGHSVGFPELLGRTGQQSIVNESILELMQFNGAIHPIPPKTLSEADDSWVRFHGYEIDTAFECFNGSLYHEGDMTIWRNNTNKYSFIKWKNRIPVDHSDFQIAIEFTSPYASIPNIIFRGDSLEKSDFPDTYGYALSCSPDARKKAPITLKKQGDAAFVFPGDAVIPGQLNQLLLTKDGSAIYLNINNTNLGGWHEKCLIRTPSDNLLFFFLRPGEEISFKFIAIHLAPSRAERQDDFPLMASCAATGRDYLVNTYIKVYDDQRPNNIQNITFCEFEEITAVKRRIDRLESEQKDLLRKLSGTGHFLGESDSVKSIRAQAQTLADSGLVILIDGDTGTGKEMLARYIHQMSSRASRPFVKVDCASIPETLLESELFGHEKGAFTGATSRHIGKFEQAQNGVLFLDEISNISFSIQAKLLGVLNDFQITRIGGSTPTPLDIRLICASNRPLEKLVAAGTFREDLFYRINQVKLLLLPLRERPEDIPILVRHFLKEANILLAKKIRYISPQASTLLARHDWPGNIRELRNVILKAVTFTSNDVLEAKDISLENTLPQKVQKTKIQTIPKTKLFQEFTRDEIIDSLRQNGGKVSAFAKVHGMSRFWAYTLLKRNKIADSDYKK
ncbi:MAG: sigma-54-dependent Fis family transcriptional regulator [Fibrobacteres bacterium]|nr:sigma-54-dependent Fis family transcriptional regulator [Fibrobacterota bacterium]